MVGDNGELLNFLRTNFGWTTGYLPNLVKRSKWYEKYGNIEVDHIVAIADSNSRNNWKMGRVIETYPGRDGQMRTVKLQTKNGMLVGPVHNLVKLEVGEC
ncbi:hypothetical protein JTB14_000461 [Gonioctena quinquepunctata]|nr:hypothetical protein JTB14_000461 [Gonioctena quinquepunctata]